MLRNLFLVLTIVFLCSILSTPTEAVSISLTPVNVSGTTAVGNAVSGPTSSTFDVEINLDTEGVAITGFGYSVSYDAAEVNVISILDSFNPPSAPFPGFSFASPIDNGTGLISSWNHSISLGGTAVSGSWLVGKVRFEILNVDADLNDISALFTGISDGVNFPTGVSASVTFGHVDVNASTVPEPASLILIGSGLIGMIGIKRKRDK